MVAVTYGVAPNAKIAASGTAPTVGAEAAAPRKPWYVRLLNAMIEARMEQARREIALHTGLMPYTYDEFGNRKVKVASDEAPAGGW